MPGRSFGSGFCSWAVNLRKPSDIGYEDGAFILPPLRYREHVVPTEEPREGMLFAVPAETLAERISARRDSVDARVAKCAEIVNAESQYAWIVWANLNAESERLSREIIGAVELTGSDPSEEKAQKSLDFANGVIGKLVTKPKIAGFGMNYQVCSHIAFVGVNDSWEQFYQAVRRCWRFGQTQPVDVHIIAASTEGNVLENLKAQGKGSGTDGRRDAGKHAGIDADEPQGKQPSGCSLRPGI